MRCVLRTIRNDAHPRTFRTLADLDYRDTPRLNCRDAPPPECSVHCIRCHELPVSMHMHCSELAMSLNTYINLYSGAYKTSRSPCVGVCGHVCARDH
jgi:hypothetical protein